MAQNNKRNYTQSFTYDKIGNMLTKVSTESKYPNVSVSALNYTNAYSYYTDAPHRAEIIGDMYYKYDNNGNVIEERQGGHREETVGGTFSYTYPDTDITRASQAFGWDRGGETEPDSTYRREYTWDEENRLTGTSDPSYTTVYTYDHEGERTVKYSDLGETLYFDSMWLEADTEGTGRLRCTKNIYIGETRIASKLNYKGEETDYEDIHTYYYHTDHLSSSNVVTDADGEVYEHIEYTPKDAWASSKLACDQPYGEKWILDQNDNSKYDMIPYRFTAKEWDEETGLYYMSARYQNPETSRWVSSDPAGWDLVNPMQKDDQGKFQIRSGFSIAESINPYSYTSHNPINYSDPTGMWTFSIGLSAEGGGCVGGTLGGKIAIGWDKDSKILSTGFVTTEGGGSFVGLGGSISITFGFSKNKSNVDDLGGTDLVVGGSADLGGSIGGSRSTPLEGGKMNEGETTVAIGLGVGAIGGEGHAMVTASQVHGKQEIDVVRLGKEIKYGIKEMTGINQFYEDLGIK